MLAGRIVYLQSPFAGRTCTTGLGQPRATCAVPVSAEETTELYRPVATSFVRRCRVAGSGPDLLNSLDSRVFILTLHRSNHAKYFNKNSCDSIP